MSREKRRALSRKEAFFGLHFDLHPTEKDTELGADLIEEMVEKLLCEVKPDYVQYDCKGHPGYTGYPTKIGWSSPGIKKDSLMIWRKITRRHGVALFIHYSGLWDEAAVKHHPEWARVDACGRRDDKIASFFGPYADELVIPQLKEVIDLYDVDGAWIDGDSWAAKLDWCEEARKEFKKLTGVKEIPEKLSDPYWEEWMEFQRRKYLEYVKRYVNAVHKYKPEFEIAVNWLYTTFAPLPIEVPVDFLSGDVTPESTVDALRFEARYLSSTGMPWDLMTWGFTRGKGRQRVFKPVVQLMQEAAIVISQGGGFSIYYQPTRSGWIDCWMIRTMAEVARFCRARQEVSQGTKTVPQVALLLSSTEYFIKLNRAGRLFGPLGGVYDSIQGLLHALLELHYSVDILAEHHIRERVKEYPLIIVPEWEVLDEGTIKLLVNYVKEGGSLLLIGARTASIFRDYLGVEFIGDSVEEVAYIRSHDVLGWLGGLWQDVKPISAKCIEVRFPSIDTRKGAKCAATINELGKGLIGAVYGPLGSTYYHLHVPALRNFLGNIVKRLFKPIVEISGPPCVDVILRCKEKKLLIHLVNVSGKQTSPNYAVVDFIPPVNSLTLSIELPEKPKSIYLIPDKKILPSEWRNGKLLVTIQQLDIHAVVVVEP